LKYTNREYHQEALLNLQNAAPKKGDDPVRDMCDKLRAKGGVEWQQAILADQRVEYVRGKDLAAFFREHPNDIVKYVSRGVAAFHSPLHLYTAS